jgi:predicted phosphodiesterase
MRLRRIGIVGDIHGHFTNLKKTLTLLRSHHDLDCVVSVGDIVDGPDSIDECCNLLIEHNVLAVRGNHERWLLSGQMRSLPHATALRALKARSRDFLASLPPERTLPVAGGVVLLSHGFGNDDMRGLPAAIGPRLVAVLRTNRAVPPSCVAVITGHSHQRRATRVGGTLFISAGTIMPSCDPCFGVLDCLRNRATFHDL